VTNGKPPKKLKSHLDPLRTTPIGMARYAIDFYAAAIAVDDRLGDQPGHEIIAPAPAYYLLGHALELGLKAYLLEKGIAPPVLCNQNRPCFGA
jgi:hypothetical protein